ncbi:outer membrane protein assembly factor BamD [Bacillus tuaregi]|uniref:hypothetical protein n=1 Tax=Bacillus tuaregi TaxID=1816695 RepID=UPI0008F91D2B|nr:hypothetical protein [Bacillus tuaregi]
MKTYHVKIRMVVLIGVFLLLGGCSSKTDAIYQESIQKGLDAIAEDDFSKAEGLFEMALEAKEDDVTAKAYLSQVQLFLQADDFIKQNNIDDAVHSLDKAITVKEGSKVIAAKSQAKKEIILTYQENQNTYLSLLNDAKGLNESGQYQESNNKLDELLKVDLTPFTAMKDEAVKLKESNNAAIRNAEIAQAQQEAQEKVAAVEQEAQKNSKPNTLSADDVVIHYSISNDGELELLIRSIILKVGQRLILTRDDNSNVSERTLFSANGTIDIFDNTKGMIAVAPGTTDITIIPGEDWDKSKVIEVTVIN